MDKHLILPVCITAGVTAIITVIITGFGKWAFAIVDAVVPISKTPEKVKLALSQKANRYLLGAVLWCVVCVGGPVGFIFDKNPLDKFEVIMGALSTFNALCGLFLLMLACIYFRFQRRASRVRGILGSMASDRGSSQP